MITKEQLDSVDFRPINSASYCSDNFEYEFNIKTQELWATYDGCGEPDFLCKVTDFDTFKDLLDTLPNLKD